MKFLYLSIATMFLAQALGSAAHAMFYICPTKSSVGPAVILLETQIEQTYSKLAFKFFEAESLFRSYVRAQDEIKKYEDLLTTPNLDEKFKESIVLSIKSLKGMGSRKFETSTEKLVVSEESYLEFEFEDENFGDFLSPVLGHRGFVTISIQQENSDDVTVEYIAHTAIPVSGSFLCKASETLNTLN